MDGFTFPAGFLWGAATAAHQIEGNNVYNDSWLMEHVPDGPYVEPSGDACDGYHRYREDIALVAGLGFNTYRFSLEWSRIEPEQGEFSQAALDHYRRVLEACREHGITPVVTFHHFTSPRWVIRQGGWEALETVDAFARYCRSVAAELGDAIAYACTLNEANIGQVLAPLFDLHGPGDWWQRASAAFGVEPERFAPFQYVASERSIEVLLAAHHAGRAAIKEVRPELPCGATLALQQYVALPGGEEEAARLTARVNDLWLDAVADDDFLGVQIYSRTRVGPQGIVGGAEGVERTQMGYEFWPEALEAVLRTTAARLDIPLLVTENGLATEDDARRVEYVERALRGVAACLRDGIDVRAYLYWSLLDNYEWALGYRPTFGLVAVDRSTQRRTPKPSAAWLGAVARSGVLPARACSH
jgi:beta-glucosidase